MKSKPATCHSNKPVYARGLCRGCYEKWLINNNPEYAERQRKNVRDPILIGIGRECLVHGMKVKD